MAECPQCNAEIGRANYCGCGWKKHGKPKLGAMVYPNEPERVKCAHETCFISASVKIQTKYGWANFCMKHYEEHFVEQGKETCQRLGLETVEQQRAYVVKGIGRLLRKREPGDDDEEIAA